MRRFGQASEEVAPIVRLTGPSDTRMHPEASSAVPRREGVTTISRLRAFAWDLPIIAAWAVAAGVIGVAFRQLGGVRLSAPWALDLTAFATLVLPVVLTFAYQEGSPAHASWGKRRMRLRVATAGGDDLGAGRSLLRSATKFAPWQMGHTAVFHLLAGSTAVGFLVLSLVAQALVVGSILVMALDPKHRALHDWVAGTRVVGGGSR